MNTRSTAKAAAEKALRHPDSDGFFKEGLGSIFRQWTALELAVYHQWGGPTSAQRAEQLVDEIYTLFQCPEKVYKDDISLILEDYLESQFNTVCEDGSPDEIGDLLVLMWRQCGEGDFNIATNALSREYQRAQLEIVKKSSGLDNGDAADSDDDETEANTGHGMDAITEEIDDEVDEMEQVPRVDPEGWETVLVGKKKKGKK